MPKINPYQILQGDQVTLSKLPTQSDTLFTGEKKEGLACIDVLAEEIAVLQSKLFAHDQHRILIVLQGMDAAGKSSTIRDIFRHTNSLGVHAKSFGKPSEEELQRDYLWRIHAHTPRRGEIAVFDRSHYEDITTVKVLGLLSEKRIEQRIRHITEFEQMLVDENTVVLKFFLHISKDAQAKQLRERLENKSKFHKFNSADMDARAQWDAYQNAWEYAIEKTSTTAAPWFVIPADKRWYRKLAIAQTIRDALAQLDLSWPDVDLSSDEVKTWLSQLP